MGWKSNRKNSINIKSTGLIFYLTIGEQPSGIYVGQVIDVCVYLTEKTGENVRLIALISTRNFRSQKKIIKSNYPNSWVMPMIPKLRFWKWNLLYLVPLLFLKKNSAIICRSALASGLGLKLKNIGIIRKVIYDGRAAEYAQIKEYGLIQNQRLALEIKEYEQKSVIHSDFKIAVSNKLVEFWEEEYNYRGSNHVVIPCTLSKHHTTEIITKRRDDLGFQESDIILIYSGSVAGWQSFDLMDSFFRNQLDLNVKIRVVLLAKRINKIKKLINDYPDRVIQIWCHPNEVAEYLQMADYGILIRESTITNKVASPVKFAEYLAAGLKVILSDNIGDYPSFIGEHSVGYIMNKSIELVKVNENDRKYNRKIAQKFFLKESQLNSNKYSLLLKKLKQ